MIKNQPTNAGDIRDVGSTPGWEDPPEKVKATHSSILAWRIPWTIQSMESDTTEPLSLTYGRKQRGTKEPLDESERGE